MAYLFVGLMFVSINVFSAFDAFSCVVKQAQFVSNDGLLVDQARYQYLVAQEFNVDKNTGAIVGAFTTDNIKKQPAIIDYGSKNQAFKVIIAHYPETTVDLLLIEVYSSSSQKPFTFITLGSVFTGLCLTKE